MDELDQAYSQALGMAAALNQRQIARRKEYDGLKRTVRKTAFAGLAIIFIVAGISDALSILDLGWLTSWLFSILMYFFIVRRIEKIDNGSKKILAKTKEAEQELRQLGGPSAAGSTIKGQINSYMFTFVRDTIITQLVELVPFLNWLPFYLGQFAKAYINMRSRYMAAKKLLAQYERVLTEVEQTENIQLEKAMAPVYDQIDNLQAKMVA